MSTYSNCYYPEHVEESQEGPFKDRSIRLLVVKSDILPERSVAIIDSEGITIGRDRSYEKRLRLPELVCTLRFTLFYSPYQLFYDGIAKLFERKHEFSLV